MYNISLYIYIHMCVRNCGNSYFFPKLWIVSPFFHNCNEKILMSLEVDYADSPPCLIGPGLETQNPRENDPKQLEGS